MDYHALTTLRDPEALRRYSLDAALDYLALGFDPESASPLSCRATCRSWAS